MSYDYAEIPAIELQWDLDPDGENWVEVRLQQEGIRYYGEDWTYPDGGAYTAGFQTYEEFFASGPLCQMPDDLAHQLRAHLEAHRKTGGVSLEVVHRNQEDLELVGAWMHLNGTWVFGMEAGALQETTGEGTLALYTGTLEAGAHQLSGVFAYHSSEEPGIVKMTMDYAFNLEERSMRLEIRPDPETARLVVALDE